MAPFLRCVSRIYPMHERYSSAVNYEGFRRKVLAMPRGLPGA